MTYSPDLSIDEAVAFGVKMRRALQSRHDVSPDDQRAIRVNNNAENNSQVSAMMLGLNILILVIGFGTLIAGIVGISNIMVYVVKERTKELGIRKALGASPNSIVIMIMLESVLITAIAGYLGLLLGVGILKLSGSSLEEYFILNPGVSTTTVVGATVTLITAGILAGYLPAKRAAQIKPIVALRAD